MGADRTQMNASMKEKALAHWGLVNCLAARRFAKESAAEEAALYVMEQLEKDDWKKLRQFGGRSSFATYFSSLVYRILEDFARKRYGRKRAPKWISRRGGIWLVLYRLLCLERLVFHEAVARAGDRRSDLPVKRIERAAEQILGEVLDCGSSVQEVSYTEEEECSEVHSSMVSRQQEMIEQRQKAQLLSSLCLELFGNENENTEAVKTLLNHRVQLSVEERAMLKLCHQQGLGVAEAGRMVGLNRFQAHGRMKRLYKRIRESFREEGYEEELRLLLEE